MPISMAETVRPACPRLNPQALQKMQPYFGASHDPVGSAPPIVRRKSFWECEADYNPLGKFGASSGGALVREALTRQGA